MKVVDFPIDEQVGSYPASIAIDAFDPGLLAQHGVDGHTFVMAGEAVVARASLWWRDTPKYEAERLGVIGHFAAQDKVAAEKLLTRLFKRLKAQGCTVAVGPMDGNTWRRYRFVSDPGDDLPFFLEPENPARYPDYFVQAGFLPLAQYTSARVTDLTLHDDRVPRAIERLKRDGIDWHPLEMSRFEQELRSIYRLSQKCFRKNFLYTPIEETRFLEQYQAVAPYVEPALTLMAERKGELLGYLFGIPDLNQSKRGESVDTFIVKTVAALPERRCAGLGSVLVAESHRIAHEQGYRYAIHALMHESNQSRNISAHYAHTMRRYTLYQKCLDSGS
ncbi:MAG: GNAT family N-acetyltransferase [Candidatus Thiodiazotropha endolucinida]